MQWVGGTKTLRDANRAFSLLYWYLFHHRSSSPFSLTNHYSLSIGLTSMTLLNVFVVPSDVNFRKHELTSPATPPLDTVHPPPMSVQSFLVLGSKNAVSTCVTPATKHTKTSLKHNHSNNGVSSPYAHS